MIRILAAALALALALALAALWLQSARLHRAQLVIAGMERDAATAAVLAEATARRIEQARAERQDEIAQAYERGKTDVQATADRVAADLRAGNLRLRNEWAGCETGRLSAAAAAAARTYEKADDRAASAGRIVRAAAECDAQVTALQALVRADRAQP